MENGNKPEKLTTIFVNGDEFEESERQISYERVADLPFPGELGQGK